MNGLAIPDSMLTEYELWMRLEGIFMPRSRRLRDEAFRRQPESAAAPPIGIQLKCAHYTSADAALKIIKSKRMWLRNTTCMSDYQEVQHGFRILNRFFSDESKVMAFKAAIDACAPGAADEAINLFNQWWQNIQARTYIASMSEHDLTEDVHGRLSMWRAFGGNAAHVAVVLNIPWMAGGARALRLIFGPVSYVKDDEVHADIYRVIENIRKDCAFLRSLGHPAIVDWVFNMLMLGVSCSKHEGFKEEREWRAIYGPNRLPSELIEPSTEVVGGIPQIVYNLPLDASADPRLADLDFSRIFDRLIIGPTQYPLVMREAFVEALTKAGVSDAGERVFVSDIPIRA